jgi:hypothetical protein
VLFFHQLELGDEIGAHIAADHPHRRFARQLIVLQERV